MRFFLWVLCLHFIERVLTKSELTFDAVTIDEPDLSVTTILQMRSAAQCGIECLNKAKECIAFTYNASAVESCHLYRSISLLDTIGTEVFAISMPVSLTQKKELG